LYDINGDNKITHDEMLAILGSIYEMMGQCTEPPIDEMTVQEHADRIFEKLDLNGDGIITRDEFYTACRNDEQLCSALHSFDTII
jgi:Ca2+-binding EF-hand superfamily protein